ncbi:alpha/beta hydrolase [Tautonia plasticadhaerens]|uniref:Phospholipase/Carboxylesterase n=1 Tax=Tautonia plasticadhaerens TaxID=2527974 RepID=A0A518GWL4_9BACT|nr:esterase [Tautonia plasticadhaerens]QDV32979.1 Phospholipase/Carboxylesterase [Tautonia plasticadhaerens]
MHHEHRTPGPIEKLIGSGPDPSLDATFVPHRYEPNYAYPLLVLLHGRGGDEQQLVDAMPTMSWRNYVGLGLRGPEPLTRGGQPSGFDWGPMFRHPRRRPGPQWDEVDPAEVVSRVLTYGLADPYDAIEDALFSAVRRTRRALHVHSERIFLVGIGEGAALAYRIGLSNPDRFAGVVALNGWIPRGFRPLRRWEDCRSLRVLALQSLWNARSPIEDARKDVALLRNAGIRVTSRAYESARSITPAMLSDVDSWLIDQCTADLP